MRNRESQPISQEEPSEDVQRFRYRYVQYSTSLPHACSLPFPKHPTFPLAKTTQDRKQSQASR